MTLNRYCRRKISQLILRTKTVLESIAKEFLENAPESISRTEPTIELLVVNDEVVLQLTLTTARFSVTITPEKRCVRRLKNAVAIPHTYSDEVLVKFNDDVDHVQREHRKTLNAIKQLGQFENEFPLPPIDADETKDTQMRLRLDTAVTGA